jgi:hypothetical protein
MDIEIYREIKERDNPKKSFLDIYPTMQGIEKLISDNDRSKLLYLLRSLVSPRNKEEEAIFNKIYDFIEEWKSINRNKVVISG